MCAIIDDRGDVWKYSPNCILVKKYHFFADTGDINDPHAFKQTGKSPSTAKNSPPLPDKDSVVKEKDEEKSPEAEKSTENDPENVNENSTEASRDSDSREAAEQLEKKTEEETDDDKDNYLLRLQVILERIHKTYYEKYDRLRYTIITLKSSKSYFLYSYFIILSGADKSPESPKLPDVRNICVDIRKDILADCKLAFSGVVPNGLKPEDHRAIKTAYSMGATYHEKIQRFIKSVF